MTLFRVSTVGCVLCTLSAGLAWAQPDATGTGGGPLTAGTGPNITAVGRTKPPSRAASPAATQPTETRPIARRTARQVADDAIGTRICIGCRVDPGTTGSLPGPAPTALPGPAAGSDPVARAPEKRDVTLDELRILAEPPRQSDLDTRPLASAHREQAQSAQEKTDGLWQSWLVSVCDGCGDQKPARALRLEEWPDRPAATDPRPQPVRVRASEIRRPDLRPHGTLEANLSPENLTGIRRMP